MGNGKGLTQQHTRLSIELYSSMVWVISQVKCPRLNAPLVSWYRNKNTAYRLVAITATNGLVPYQLARPRLLIWRTCGGKANTYLTHWGRVTHICVSKLTIIGSDNGLSPGRRQAIIWTNDGFLLIGPLGTNFSEILIEINTFSFKKMHLKMSSGKWRPFVSASMC